MKLREIFEFDGVDHHLMNALNRLQSAGACANGIIRSLNRKHRPSGRQAALKLNPS